MSLSDQLDVLVIAYVSGHYIPLSINTDIFSVPYEAGRKWLKNTTGEDKLEWHKAVIQLVKQRSSRLTRQ